MGWCETRDLAVGDVIIVNWDYHPGDDITGRYTVLMTAGSGLLVLLDNETAKVDVYSHDGFHLIEAIDDEHTYDFSVWKVA